MSAPVSRRARMAVIAALALAGEHWPDEMQGPIAKPFTRRPDPPRNDTARITRAEVKRERRKAKRRGAP